MNIKNDLETHALRFSKFLYLWKTDDKEWVKQRKQEWRSVQEIIGPKCSAKYLKYVKAFYLTGAESADPTGENFSDLKRFEFTPFQTVQEVQDMFELISHPRDKEQVMSSFLSTSCRDLAGMPWLREKIHLFIQGIFGREYKRITAFNGPQEIVISPDPVVFCSGYISSVKRLLQGKSSYEYCVDTVDYFISALAHTTQSQLKNWTNFEEFMDLVDKAAQNPQAYPEITQSLLQQLSEKKELIWASWEKTKDTGSVSH